MCFDFPLLFVIIMLHGKVQTWGVHAIVDKVGRFHLIHEVVPGKEKQVYKCDRQTGRPQRHNEGRAFTQDGNTRGILLYWSCRFLIHHFLLRLIHQVTTMGSVKSAGLTVLLLSVLLYVADSYPNNDLSNSKN